MPTCDVSLSAESLRQAARNTERFAQATLCHRRFIDDWGRGFAEVPVDAPTPKKPRRESTDNVMSPPGV